MIANGGQRDRLVFDDLTIGYLDNRLAEADAAADRCATKGGELRAQAAKLIAQADQADEQAVNARAEADQLRELLDFAHKHNGQPEPQPPAATDQLVAGRSPYPRPFPGDTAAMPMPGAARPNGHVVEPFDACQTLTLPSTPEGPDAAQ